MPNYDLNGDPLPDDTPGGATPPQPPPQYGQPTPPPQVGTPYGQQPPPYGQQQPQYGQQPPPYGQQPGAWPPPPGQQQYGQGGVGYGAANDSGTGPTAQLPLQLQGFNWGAFFLNWIWSIAHKTWIGLLCFVPCVNIVMIFVLGFKGNEWAWQNQRWDSIEQFQDVQRKWMIWGVVVFCISLVVNIIRVAAVFSGNNASNHSGF